MHSSRPRTLTSTLKKSPGGQGLAILDYGRDIESIGFTFSGYGETAQAAAAHSHALRVPASHTRKHRAWS